jgi:hypothetical protein
MSCLFLVGQVCVVLLPGQGPCDRRDGGGLIVQDGGHDREPCR